MTVFPLRCTLTRAVRIGDVLYSISAVPGVEGEMPVFTPMSPTRNSTGTQSAFKSSESLAAHLGRSVIAEDVLAPIARQVSKATEIEYETLDQALDLLWD
ncbi:MAG TPA: hypothetical protein QF564_19670 [Pirellulaceae bacterium]|nr:hypothetical protein [Pirellulaceae bacterium]